MNLSNTILRLRKNNHMSQEELSEKLGVSRQTISRWENGNALPDANNIVELAKCFSISTDELLEYSPKHSSPTAKSVYPSPKKTIRFQEKLGIFFICFGFLGNFTLYILSRMVKVMVPTIKKNSDGATWYHWDGARKNYHFKFFIEHYHLELLVLFFCILIILGIACILVKKDTRFTFFKKKKISS